MTDHAQDRILIITDNEDIAQPLHMHFSQHGSMVMVARSAEAGLQAANNGKPDLILLAATVENTDGVPVFHRLRRTPLTAHIPVMFITDFRDSARQNQLLAEGADDVILQPFDVEILALRVRNAIQRTRREGLTDSTTGLPTGALLAERIASQSAVPGACELTIVVDHFDSFRSRYDFITGNEVLRYIANELRETASEQEFVAMRSEGQYVILTSSERAPALTATIEEQIGTGILNFYTFMEREQGFVEIEDGLGGAEQHPLMQLRVTQHPR
jgi:DNA-binding response OmpR family regulator